MIMFSMEGTVMILNAMHALMKDEVRLLCLPDGILRSVSMVRVFTL